jgi:hypothetical protein
MFNSFANIKRLCTIQTLHGKEKNDLELSGIQFRLRIFNQAKRTSKSAKHSTNKHALPENPFEHVVIFYELGEPAKQAESIIYKKSFSNQARRGADKGKINRNRDRQAA